MSSEHAFCLFRRPLPPKVKPPAIPRPSGGPRLPPLLNRADPSTREVASRQEADTPAPRAAPPTPVRANISTLLTDRVTEGFPCKLPRTQRRNPLLELLQSGTRSKKIVLADRRFRAPPPTFCLSDFLQNHNGSQFGSQSPPV
ncbi:hypothetical protein Q5P01_014125 [Channa striata]|uniref:Uncharacterized protein n=1 Tax=Channa striata TaxID=64152 RepID=A0AA88MNN5_CHASR|nr:hypothetical protein Q5P01_014125 [Channa striata]